MHFTISTFIKFFLPWALFVLVMLVVIFAKQSRDWLLPSLLLLLPFIDIKWQLPGIFRGKRFCVNWVILTAIIALLLFQNPDVLEVFVVMVLVAAIPEEWFFRAYLQKQLGNSATAVIIVSLLFSMLHYLSRNSATAWLVFMPSVFFGWVYKKTDDVIFVILLHALSNLLYYIYLESFFC